MIPRLTGSTGMREYPKPRNRSEFKIQSTVSTVLLFHLVKLETVSQTTVKFGSSAFCSFLALNNGLII
jgi:hypothetical protein